MDPFSFVPIGVLRTPFTDRVSAPRQAVAAREVQGTIELFPGRGFEDALSDLAGWEMLWVIFVFHLNEGWRPKVLPPRSSKRRGVFATRSPHRPNPIGLSAVRLVAIDGLILRIAGVDMIDRSPVLDIKPYVAYADAHPGAAAGWLEGDAGDPPSPQDERGPAPPVPDPEPGYAVAFSAVAAAQLSWLRDAHGVDLAEPIARVLALGPQPHAYRRIRKEGDGLRLALKDWRARFRVEGRSVVVESIASGYRPSQLAYADGDANLELHRDFTARFAIAPAP